MDCGAMSCQLPITIEFFHSVSNPAYSQRRLIFTDELPELKDFGSDFLYTCEDGVLEIILAKSTVKKVVSECYPIMKNHLASRSVCSIVDVHDNELLQLYYMTIGMLLVTNEHHTIINLHDGIVFKILGRIGSAQLVFGHLDFDPIRFIFRELSFLQGLLNSNNNKLNKSSSLWTFFKKLFIFAYDNASTVMTKLPHLFFFNTAICSAELHPSNYYAWNFIKFTTNVSKIRANCSLHLEIVKLVEKYCKTHVNDASAWMCYVDVIQLNTAALQLVCFEFNRIAKNSTLHIDSARTLLTYPSSNQPLMELSKWLWDTKPISEVPFHAFQQLSLYSVKIWKEDDLIRQLFHQIKVHCTLYEELKLKPFRIDFDIKNGYMSSSADTSCDYELQQELENYYHWKRLLNWFEKFLQDRLLGRLE